MTTNIFERASRTKLRIVSSKGALSVEQLWDLPLSSAKSISLDSVGQGVQRELRELSEDSLVETTPSARKTELTLALDLIKHIIAAKQADNLAAREKAARAGEKAKLLEALETKQNANLANMSEEALREKLAELDNA